ncbi:MAG TPA: YbhN family protein, partial [Solirubrobacteraceae bacterium]|nr:YbhN family protein [Solirubrobacteraceae bacterium]
PRGPLDEVGAVPSASKTRRPVADCEQRRRATQAEARRRAAGVSGAHAGEPSPAPDAIDSRGLRRRLIGLAVAAIAVSSLLLAVPGLNDVVGDIGRMQPGWIVLALVLEIASCASFAIVFRAFFGSVPGPLARRVAWTEMGSGALLPGGGLTGYALGGVLLHDAGLGRRRVVILSGGLFWLTTFVNGLALAAAAVLLLTGASHGPHDFLRAGLPLIIAVVSTATVLLLALWARRSRRGWQTALGEGVHEAVRTARNRSWRLLGALGYLGFDIAVLWCTFRALGSTPSVGALMIGYLIGYLATTIPIPAGIGVLEGGLAAVLVLYGTPATRTIAAVLVYHAIAFWVPSLGGVLAYMQLRRPMRRPRRPRRARGVTRRLTENVEAHSPRLEKAA